VRAIRATRPDLVVGVNTPDVYPAVNRLRREGSAVRVAMAIHGIEPGIYGDARRFRGIVDGVVASNRLACQLAVELGGLVPARIHYAHYGLDVPDEDVRRPAIRGTLRIGFAGRIVEDQKRAGDLAPISRALEAMDVPHHLTIAGEGAATETLRRSLTEDRATFLGALRAADLRETLYRNVDAVLITSDWETGPLVALEAMAAGTPVVSSRFVGSVLESALRDGQNALLFDVGDAGGAASQLARLRSDPELQARIRRGGFRLVTERYSRSSSVRSWERGLAAVLDAPPLPPEPAPVVPGATGRLESILGAGRAETVRAALRRTGPDAGTAGEWPHSYGSSMSAAEFLRLAERVDRDGRQGTPEDAARCSRR
jgi:glycosyltransferase involved in cell wall biosynthesis